jgi:hypothetical protein
MEVQANIAAIESADASLNTRHTFEEIGLPQRSGVACKLARIAMNRPGHPAESNSPIVARECRAVCRGCVRATSGRTP